MNNRFILFIILIVVSSLVACASKQSETASITTNSKPINSLSHTHSWSEWEEIIEVTCTNNGLMERKCECGEIDTIPYAALGHDYSDWRIEKESSCNTTGLESRNCFRCNEKETRATPVLEHIEGEWYIDNNEKHLLCLNCKSIIKTEELIISTSLYFEKDVLKGIIDNTDTEIVVPDKNNNDSIRIIGMQAFKDTMITSVILPNSIVIIEDSAFYQCFKLESIHLGSGVAQIGRKAFFKCTSLDLLILPDSLENIGEYAFAYCSNLQTVYIGNKIQKLESGVFQDCKKLTDIYFDGTMSEWDSIHKDIDWDLGTAEYVVHCTDGDISK